MTGPADTHTATSSAILDAFIDRSWRSNAERQRRKGVDFVIGHREGVFLWNVDGTHRVIDCGTGGGVHALGHRHPEIVDTLRTALDDGCDTGLWTVPNAAYLALQDRLARQAPIAELNRSVITLASTASVDLAVMCAFRMTGRRRILAYRQGYHGHTGFAALVTGSLEEGIIEHYNLPPQLSDFFDAYGDIDAVAEKMTDDIAAVILEPLDYETFQLAPPSFLADLGALCQARGILVIIDETRTGLGRTGRLWASAHYNVSPDMLITGKGLSGGLYPASAVLMRQDIYERCINMHPFSYISSLGGNEISCRVADKVLDIASRPETLAHVQHLSSYLKTRLMQVATDCPDLFGTVYAQGAIFTLETQGRQAAKALYAKLFEYGVLCHSVCETDPAALKFFPPLLMTLEEADLVETALRRAAATCHLA